MAKVGRTMMKKKRGNENAQMRREEYDAAETGPAEEAGNFRKADASKLQGRKMIKARRRAKPCADPYFNIEPGGVRGSALASIPLNLFFWTGCNMHY